MQFFDVYNLASGQFILRAHLSTISLIYHWQRAAEQRIERSGTAPTDVFGNKFGPRKHEAVRVVPVMDDWQPASMPDKVE